MNLPLRKLGVLPNAWEVNQTLADITRPEKTPQPVVLATETKTLRCDLSKAAIIVIDMQNDFCHPDGWLAHIGVDVTPAQQPIAPLQQLLPQIRAAGVPVIWLNWGNRHDLLNISAGLLHVYN
ncbi:MAG: isochorismatase family protein, partial [Dolichospermum sp.]